MGWRRLQLDHGPIVEFEPENVPATSIEATSRGLAALLPGDTSGDGSLPDTVGLAELGAGLEPDDLIHRGQRTEMVSRCRSDGSPAAASSPRPRLATDLTRWWPAPPVPARANCCARLLAGLAIRHPPCRLNLLLVDYKGGAAFGPLADLPHCVGLVTDLGPAEVARTLTALRAELRRRELLLDGHARG